jgi:hypothetical protein
MARIIGQTENANEAKSLARSERRRRNRKRISVTRRTKKTGNLSPRSGAALPLVIDLYIQ